MNLAALLPLITGQAGQGLASAAMGPQMPQGMDMAQPQQMAQAMPQGMPHQQMQPQRKGLFGGVGSPFRNFLGALGDALLVANGGQPMYQQRLQQKRMGEALGNYLGKINADPALMELIQADPSLGMQMYQASQRRDPEEIALMRQVGIDPQSPEGRAIITRKLTGGGGQDPNFVRELEALGIDPRSDEARELYYGRNSPAGYLLKPPSRGEQASAESLPVINSQVEYDALAPGTRYRDSQGNVGVKAGGPTPSASGGFR